jgi:predicted acyltransferase
MLGMILVDFLNNDEEGSTWWLIHPDWNGFTPADLIFPAFLFIMGIAIPMAVSKNRPIKPRNVVRVFLLFLIGLALNIIEQLDFPTR